MKTFNSGRLVQAILRNPWSSVQDGLLLSSVMLVAALLTLEYDLFNFAEQITTPQRRITLAEAIFLTVLLALCIFAFILRRLREERHNTVRHVVAKDHVRKFRALALQDSMTSLPNRHAMLKALAAATTASPSDHRTNAFLLIDLNDFKQVNDQHGHAHGDRVLRVVAERFRTVSRPSDLLARLGGDEFAVLSYDVNRETAEAIALRFITALESEIRVEGHSHRIGASVGAVLISDGGTTAEEIVHNADLAMYRAKGQARSSLEFFGPTENNSQQIA